MENILHLLSMYSLAGAEGVADHDARAAGVPPTRDDIALCLSCMDYTSLESTDTAASITAKLATLRDRLWRYALPEVAAACVLPRFAGEARRALAGSAIRTAVVAGGFPTGGTFPEVKAFECGRTIEAGAEEIDTVLAPGGVMEREYDGIFEELLTLRAACPGVTLKVIIEAGELKSDEDVFNATLLCAYAGADFVKTSTGKTPVGATPGAVRVMCEAVRQYHAREGRRVGIKVAGGVATADDALSYMQIVRRVLGDAWLSPRLFRLGASRLLDALVEAYRV